MMSPKPEVIMNRSSTALTLSHCTFLLLLIVFPLISSSSLAQGLFTPVAPLDLSLTPQQASILQAIRLRPEVINASIVRVNVLALNGSSVALDVPGLENAPAATRKRVFTRGEKDFTWIGEIQNQSLPGSTILLVVAGDEVTGAFHTDETSYTVEPLGGGFHALVLVNRSQFAQCAVGTEGSAVGAEGSSTASESISSLQTSSNAGTETLSSTVAAPEASLQAAAASELKVLIAYTPRAANESGNISSVAQGAIDALNDAFRNSNVPVTATLVRLMQVSYTETGSQSTAVNRLRGKSDGYMDNVHLVRAQYHADVVALLNDEDDPGLGGFAAQIGASVSTAFVAVQWNRAIGEYVLAHEIGHLAGGRHQRTRDPGTTPYQYGHGYVYFSGNWRTVLAVPEENPNTGRIVPPIAYWSNPDKIYGGVPMGTTTYEDMARVWEVRGPVMAGWGESIVAPPTNLKISNAYSYGSLPKLTWTASVDPVKNYKVLRRDTYNPSWAVIGTTTATSWTDSGITIEPPSNANAEYFYVVQTVRTDNKTSDYSNQVSTLGKDFCPYCSSTAASTVDEPFALAQNYPNPFNPSTEIKFSLPEAVHVSLVVYDMMGREVARLVDRPVEAGHHTVTFEASHLASGIYLYRITAGSYTQTNRMTLMK